MGRSRREFLASAAAAGAAAAAASLSGPRRADAQPPPGGGPRGELPAIIATWSYGVDLCAAAQKALASGARLIDAIEKGVNVIEDDPKVTSVGYGGLPNEDGVVQLDAAIMDGRTHQAGAVAALEGIKNPISVARKVMERTTHVLLVGAGAQKFALKMGFKTQDLMTPAARAKWEAEKASFWREAARKGDNHDTVACIGIDAAGNLVSAVSTSGLAWKLAGRVGDSPIIGAGSYVDNEVGGAAATGNGELAIRSVASFAIVERMRAGADPTRACEEVLERVMKKQPQLRTDSKLQLAFIAMDKQGRVGAAVVRKQKKEFRYGLMRGLKAAPVLVDVKPIVAA